MVSEGVAERHVEKVHGEVRKDGDASVRIRTGSRLVLYHPAAVDTGDGTRGSGGSTPRFRHVFRFARRAILVQKTIGVERDRWGRYCIDLVFSRSGENMSMTRGGCRTILSFLRGVFLLDRNRQKGNSRRWGTSSRFHRRQAMITFWRPGYHQDLDSPFSNTVVQPPCPPAPPR
ncbi:unnamed protein product [Scytosiphon promiscuus]